MAKPKFLYHGSSNKNIVKLVPQAITVRSWSDGRVVFATPSKSRASLFIVPSDDDWTNKSTFNDINYHLISDKERYLKLDKGGAIYTLSPDSFESDDKGNEWISKVSVLPIGKEIFKSGVKAMEKYGVKIIFCDYDFLQKYKQIVGENKISEAFEMIKYNF